MRSAARTLALAASTLLAIGCLVCTATPAAAHDVLVSTSPADKATVASTPAAVVLTFDQPALAIGTELVVDGPAGPAQDGKPQLVDTTVRQALKPGSPAGTYRVQWRVTSADGHAVSGTFSFTSSAAGTGTSTPSATGATTAAAAKTTGDTGNGRGVPWWLVVVVVLIGGAVLVRSRRGRQGRRPGPS